MRLFFAVVIGLAIASVGLAMIRSLVRGSPTGQPRLQVAQPPPPGVRVLFWCETCDTELLLLRRGSEAPPRHCGEPMIRREEIVRER